MILFNLCTALRSDRPMRQDACSMLRCRRTDAPRGKKADSLGRAYTRVYGIGGGGANGSEGKTTSLMRSWKSSRERSTSRADSIRSSFAFR